MGYIGGGGSGTGQWTGAKGFNKMIKSDLNCTFKTPEAILHPVGTPGKMKKK